MAKKRASAADAKPETPGTPETAASREYGSAHHCLNCRMPQWIDAKSGTCTKLRIDISRTKPVTDCDYWRRILGA